MHSFELALTPAHTTTEKDTILALLAQIELTSDKLPRSADIVRIRIFATDCFNWCQ